jgi:UDP-N-acetylmuramate--alanine ligase
MITGIFQPHLFSRTNDLMNDFASSLSLLDELILQTFIQPGKTNTWCTSEKLLSKVTLKTSTAVAKTTWLNFLKQGHSRGPY